MAARTAPGLRSTGVAAALGAALLSAWLGCNAILSNEPGTLKQESSGAGGGSGSSGLGGAGPSCASLSDCPPNTDCISYLCTNSHCQATQLPAGTEVQSGKVVGDCKRIVCTGAGTTTLTNADDDPPASPDPCTKKTCGGGEVLTTPQPDNTGCGNGLFCKGGICVGCKSPADCPLPPECQSVDCQSMACVYANVPDGAEIGDNSVKDDCMHTVCMAGVKSVTPDPSEIPPPDGAVCTDDTCDANGQPSYVAAMENAVCGAPAAPCFADSVCKSGMCTPQLQMNGFLLPDANPGNCKREACDGAGNVMEVPFNDAPFDAVSSDCKAPACANGMVTQIDLANGTPCMGAVDSTCCGGTCCGGPASVCAGAAGNTCCDSGKACGTNCCMSAQAACSGANGATCCEGGKVCGTNCCMSNLAACSGPGGVNCCNSGKVCATTCCANVTDGCVGGSMCCAANRICNGGTVCCPAAMTCQGGTTCA